ncbi:ankyrin repeat domain-containing protein [Paraflavitalea sp. CAU 1676]|uniref:ankyrin repeat domain-containing protein n=1 Tax=Paraflavitalea sp. CAU 1676 TaxID=3032598 RepID=UPI0023DBE273|nr:ankyrin repeat domain-containing protein [Paraflavitalea sp. CAU 1676]MDF2192938.1 ankyrin repeat domain-containing protein [Paraflavitalea sp. CAU 1676]
MYKLFVTLAMAIGLSSMTNAQNLLEAVEAKDYVKTEQLLKEGAKVNKANKDGQFALWKAVWNDDEKMVELLLKNNADAKQLFKGKDGSFSCLSIASQEGFLNIAKLLVDAGADPNEKNFRGHSPLRIAARNGRTELVKYFVSKGAEADTRGDDGATPLEHAAGKGHLDIVTILVEHGANVNNQDNDKDFPLGEAARSGYIDIVNYLLSKGADISLRNKEGQSALDLARISGQAKVEELLKQKAKG